MVSGDPPLDTSLLLYALQINSSINKVVSNIKKWFAALHEPVLLFLAFPDKHKHIPFLIIYS